MKNYIHAGFLAFFVSSIGFFKIFHIKDVFINPTEQIFFYFYASLAASCIVLVSTKKGNISFSNILLTGIGSISINIPAYSSFHFSMQEMGRSNLYFQGEGIVQFLSHQEHIVFNNLAIGITVSLLTFLVSFLIKSFMERDFIILGDSCVGTYHFIAPTKKDNM